MHKTDCALSRFVVATAANESGKLQPNECGNRAKFHTTKGSLEVSFPVFQLGVGGFCNNSNNSSSRRIRISSHRRRRRRRRASVRNNRCCQQSACVGEASFFSFLFFTHLFSSTLLSFHPHSLLSFFYYFPPAKPKENGDAPVGKRKKMGERGLSLFLFDSCPMASCRHTKGEH